MITSITISLFSSTGEYNSNRIDSVEWKNQVDQSHSQGGLKLDNNEIVIPHNGLYFVYSQASFRVKCSSHDDADDDDSDDDANSPMIHLSHTVKRWSSSYGNEDTKPSYYTILHSVRTACQKTESSDADEQGSWFSAIYMGAVFNLKAEDRLKTEMEQKMLLNLEDEPGKTFFGVFALWPGDEAYPSLPHLNLHTAEYYMSAVQLSVQTLPDFMFQDMVRW